VAAAISWKFRTEPNHAAGKYTRFRKGVTARPLYLQQAVWTSATDVANLSRVAGKRGTRKQRTWENRSSELKYHADNEKKHPIVPNVPQRLTSTAWKTKRMVKVHEAVKMAVAGD
jgi:hypothetical protein